MQTELLVTNANMIICYNVLGQGRQAMVTRASSTPACAAAAAAARSCCCRCCSAGSGISLPAPRKLFAAPYFLALSLFNKQLNHDAFAPLHCVSCGSALSVPLHRRSIITPHRHTRRLFTSSARPFLRWTLSVCKHQGTKSIRHCKYSSRMTLTFHSKFLQHKKAAEDAKRSKQNSKYTQARYLS